MKTNVIIPQSHQIDIQSNGTLAIIGRSQYALMFMATHITVVSSPDLSRFAKNVIETRLTGETGDTIFFEYNLQGDLRNPQRLLKSVRNKLMRELHRAHSESDRQYYETYENFPSDHSA